QVSLLVRRRILRGRFPCAFPLQHRTTHVLISRVRSTRGVTMSSRELLWLAGVALVALALLLTDRLLWQPGLTEANVRRLRPGMTRAEVEALRGGPAAETIDWWAEGQPRDPLRVRWQRHWKAEGVAVDVQFFGDGRVMPAAGGRRSQPSPLAR